MVTKTILNNDKEYWDISAPSTKPSTKFNDFHYCDFCGSIISKWYLDIINVLKENELIPQDYKKRCCFCNIAIKYLGEEVFQRISENDIIICSITTYEPEYYTLVVYNCDEYLRDLEDHIICAIIYGGLYDY